MSSICPSILTDNPEWYRDYQRSLGRFAHRVQIDLMDGDFAPARSILPEDVEVSQGLETDIHLMFRYPVKEIETLVGQRPARIIVHAEAEEVERSLQLIRQAGIGTGLALLPGTAVQDVAHLLPYADHVLLFAGNLGHYGGVADLSVLDKVPVIKTLYPTMEIGWDGGANLETVGSLVEGGVDVISVGSAIARAEDPGAAYARLVEEVNKVKK